MDEGDLVPDEHLQIAQNAVPEKIINNKWSSNCSDLRDILLDPVCNFTNDTLYD